MAQLIEDDDVEHELTGGNVAAKVVRIGRTVRKPVTRSTSCVEAFLRHLHHAGFRHAPRSLGRDDAGRYILEYIEGETIQEPDLLTLDDLHAIGMVIRKLHQAASTFSVPCDAEWSVATKPDHEDLICHNDLGAWNLVRSGSEWVFIDWDGVGPSSRLWDLAYAAQTIVHLSEGGDPTNDGVRLRAFIDGYQLTDSEHALFPEIICQRMQAAYQLLEEGARDKVQPWLRIYQLDGGDYWRKAAAYVRRHKEVWASVL